MDKMDAENFNSLRSLIILIFGIVQLTQSVPQGPNDAVAETGEDVTFTYMDPAMTTSDYFFWCKYTPTLTNIYTKGDMAPSNPSKYSVTTNGTFILTIFQVGFQDALTYCFYSQEILGQSCANLVVIDSVDASVNPMGESVGQLVNLTCLLQYGLPPGAVKPLSPDQDPQLTMYIGSSQIQTMPGIQVVGASGMLSSKSISANRTIQMSDIGESLICLAVTKTPGFSDASSSPVARSATNEVTIDYVNKTTSYGSNCCYLNDILNCTANGYPYPTINWLNVSANNAPISASMTGNGYASIVLSMGARAAYILQCSARNDLSNSTYYGYITVYPNGSVSENNTLAVKDAAKDNKVALGVGLGIGIGVPVLIGIIALIVILSKLKKSGQPYAVKQPETKAKAQPTGKAPLNNNGKAPEPGRRNNVNPNPNPTYTTPVMPEQTGTVAPKNVRDSPGYGDLGVRHIGGSGSNPRLNESFDSQADKSFDSASNRQSGGNINFVGGKTNHSPSAPNTSV